MVRLGAREAIMTVPDGCFARIEDNDGPAIYRVTIEEQEARSAVGSGDAFLAGYVCARYAGSSPIDCLRFGVACGAESTQHFGAGIIDPARADRLLGEVQSARLPVGAEIG
jgi:sugar/nucleoside kinase (ribokinase family)